MARVIATIVSADDVLKTQVARLLRDGRAPVSLIDARQFDVTTTDLIIIDGRMDLTSAMASVERFRAAAPSVNIFLIARDASTDLVLQSMRSGANEFLTWPLDDSAFAEAVGRAAGRLGSTMGRRMASVLVFVGAKGGVGTTTLAVNCGVELAGQKKTTIMVDLKQGLGDVALFLGVRSQHTVLDAIENAHRMDSDFLGSLVAKHVSGLELLPGSDQFERPTAADALTIEGVLQMLAQRYEYIVIDAGSQLSAAVTAALYTSEMIGVVINPDVPSIRNAQRLIERVSQMGACGERVRVLLNRAAEPFPIPLPQIEGALGQRVQLTFPSDYRTVATALNSGMPLTFSDNANMAAQFKRLTKLILNPSAPVEQEKEPRKKTSLGLPRFASMW